MTARSERQREGTEQWLDVHFPGVFHQLHFTGAFAHLEKEHVQANLPAGSRSVVTQHKRSKAEVGTMSTQLMDRSFTQLGLCYSLMTQSRTLKIVLEQTRRLPSFSLGSILGTGLLPADCHTPTIIYLILSGNDGACCRNVKLEGMPWHRRAGYRRLLQELKTGPRLSRGSSPITRPKV